MPTYYLLDENEKNVVFKMREGIQPLTPEDHEKLYEEAYMLFNQWQRRIRGQVVMPQDGLDYWVAVATRQHVLQQLGIKTN
jgi:hypothetical protein